MKFWIWMKHCFKIYNPAKSNITKSTEEFAQISVYHEFCIWCPQESILCHNTTPVIDMFLLRKISKCEMKNKSMLFNTADKKDDKLSL